MIDPVFGAVLAAAFCLLFASAALHKLLDRGRFSEAFRAYQLVPETLDGLALLVPFLELAVAAGLLDRITRPLAAAVGIMLLAAYAGAIAVNLNRGRTDVSCGCGGPNDRTPIAPWMVVRNLTLAELLSVTLLRTTGRPMQGVDVLTVGAGAAVAALLYLSIDGLLGRAAARAALLRGTA